MLVKIVNEDFTVLTLKRLSGDAFQVLAVCLLSTLLSIAILAKYKVTESSRHIVSYYALTNKTILLLVMSVIILMDCTACFS